jgi:hypothetical protein
MHVNHTVRVPGREVDHDNSQHSAFLHEYNIGLSLDPTPEAADCLRL